MNWKRFNNSVSTAFLRTLLIGINIIFLFSGAVLFLVGFVVRNQLSTFLDISSETSSSAPYVLIGLGLIIFFIGLFAFWSTMKGVVVALYIYSVIVFIIFISEIVLAVMVLHKKNSLEDTFKGSLTKIINDYPKQPGAQSVDQLQSMLSCCGIKSYTDWFDTNYGQALAQVPESCCKKNLLYPCNRTHLHSILSHQSLPSDIHLQLLGVMLSCCLASSLRKQRYEPVE
ncbi:unnamed protein product [Didymodactylos carnosus]|uniref:Tetraspanin n=1 Tax=Didymodactylos carnosus TaxID=1234261 RepID=A0A813WKT8_9BILA|nr:unnamed protein product [Didymodactylos carnosus]CAF3646997.1 unnamed protein product [Didymodactylos carnosus]